jgi:putative flippase GtrA
MNEAIVIPALDPTPAMLKQIRDLFQMDFQHIVIVDDGSSPDKEPLFDKALDMGCIVLHHEKNLGKGQSLKDGIRRASMLWSLPVITADADGQHLPIDIYRLAREMETYPDALVLGARDFSIENVPFKSRAGNRITSKVFRLATGKSCSDTQTGLRGIPLSLIPLALSEDGSRYEYEMNFLMDAVQIAPLRMLPIETVYENGNAGSHFRPMADSIRIYARPIRFALSSLAGAACDYTIFALALFLLARTASLEQAERVILATVSARLVSGAVNFELNRRWSFKSKNGAAGDLGRYLLLFFSQMAISAVGTAGLSYLLPAIGAKVIVDVTLFFLSYYIQKNWVFKKKAARKVKPRFTVEP